MSDPMRRPATGGWARAVLGGGSVPEEQAIEAQLEELRRRLDELGRSVEVLASEGVWPGQGTPASSDSAMPDPVAVSIAAPEAAPPPPPPPQPAEWEQPLDPEPPARPPSPAETSEVAPARAVEAAVIHVEAGPLADLIEVRRLEEGLAGLAGVGAVLLRRYGSRRARIDVRAPSARALAEEVTALGRAAEADVGGHRVLRIDLTAAGEREDGERSGAGSGES